MNSSGSKKDLFVGASGSLFLKGSFTGLSLVIVAALARVLGAEGFGLYTLCITLVNLLVVPAMIGAPPLVLREVSSSLVRGDWSLLRGLLVRLGGLSLGTAGGILALGAFVILVFPGLIPERFIMPLIMAYGVLPGLALLQIYSSALRGFEHVLLGQFPEHIFRPMFFLLSLGSVSLFLPELNAETALGLQVLATWAAFGMSLALLVVKLPASLAHYPSRFDTGSWLRSAYPIILSSWLNVANKEASIFFLGFLQGPESVGVYRVAQRGADLVLFGLLAVNMVLAPALSRLYTQEDWPGLQKIITRSSRLILLLSVPMAMVLIIGAPFALPGIFGADFAQSYWPLVVLCLGQLANAAFGAVGLILNMLHRERFTLYGLLLGVIANMILNCVLIPVWGIIGAAAATSLSTLIWNIVLAMIVYRVFGLSTTAIPFGLGRIVARQTG